MKHRRFHACHGQSRWTVLLALLVIAGLIGWVVSTPKMEPPVASPSKTSATAVKPSLTVTTVAAQNEEWPQLYAVDGNVLAWQEAVIGAELGQYRITEVAVQVGDRVKKGQVLARIAVDAVSNEVAEARAAVAELEASALEAKGNAQRSQALRVQGFYSSQMHTQFTTAEQTAVARLEAARARLQSAELRMRKTSVLAPDDGVISARSASVGSLTQQGQELFRLIRFARLEWQAEASAAVMAQIKVAANAFLIAPNGEKVTGRVRAVAPNVDPRTRNGIVYVDLPTDSGLRAGIFARGEIEMGRAPALTLPQAALVLREGHSYVFALTTQTLAGGNAQEQLVRVEQIRVKTGRRNADRVEIVAGLKPELRVVASGAGFLADGDVVRVVAKSAESATASKPQEGATP